MWFAFDSGKLRAFFFLKVRFSVGFTVGFTVFGAAAVRSNREN
jgi:hypothetical protein